MNKSEFTYEDALLALNNWAKDKFIVKNIDYDKSEGVSCFIQYLNYLSKLVVAKPRKVLLSKEFHISDENKKGFDELRKKLINGENINAYLSKSSIVANSIDGMLDNFGIKHFHLGEVVEGNFIRRTCEIALGVVTDSEVFFVVSKLHGKGHGDIWYEKDVLEIIHRENPKLIKHCKFEHVVDVYPAISNTEDIKSIRNANINGCITLDDGSIYMPFNLGQTLAGFGVCHMIYMQKIAKNICYLADELLKNNENLSSIEVSNFDLTEDGAPKLLEFKLWNGKECIKYLYFWDLGKSSLG